MAPSDAVPPAGHFFVAGFAGATPTDEIFTLITDYGLGGVILYEKNCPSAAAVVETTRSLQSAAADRHNDPLLIAIDQEQGDVVRIKEGVTLFPSMPELAKLEDEEVIRRVAGAVSRELRALGINWNLAPVADVPLTGSCPVANRSFGGDPFTAAALTGAYVRGAEEAGLISCLKHFPGHGGVCDDSHVTSPVDGRPAAEILERDLLSFREGISAGAPAVMTAHVTFTDIDAECPATFSRTILRDLLRRDLGFRGVVVSDDLEMAGAAGRYRLADASLQALAAGVDLLIVSGMILPEHDLPGLIEEVDDRIAGGEVAEERLRDAARRITSLKDRYLGGAGTGAGAEVLRCPAHIGLLARIRERLGR